MTPGDIDDAFDLDPHRAPEERTRAYRHDERVFLASGWLRFMLTRPYRQPWRALWQCSVSPDAFADAAREHGIHVSRTTHAVIFTAQYPRRGEPQPAAPLPC